MIVIALGLFGYCVRWTRSSLGQIAVLSRYILAVESLCFTFFQCFPLSVGCSHNDYIVLFCHTARKTTSVELEKGKVSMMLKEMEALKV